MIQTAFKLAVGCLVFCISTSIYANEEAFNMEDDEAGLWMKVEKHEQFIRTSSFRIRDEALESILNGMVCKLVGSECQAIRVYALRTPGFNAFMMPNGAMFIQSGLLLRVADPSELAAVIAHEIVHYQEKHTIEAIRRASRTAATFAVLGSLVGAAGSVATLGATTYAGAAQASNITQTSLLMIQSAQLVAGMALLSYSRDDERESDKRGLKLLKNGEYRLTAGATLWTSYLNEHEAGGNDSALSLVSTHPLPSERVRYLKEIAEREGATVTEVTQDESDLMGIISRSREEWLLMEMRVLNPKQFSHLADVQARMPGVSHQYLNHLRAQSWEHYSERQALSKSKSKKAKQMALEEYEKAHESNWGLSADAYRDWGMLALKLGKNDAAILALKQYLLMDPNAWDKAFIEKKIDG